VISPDLWPRVEQLYHAALAREEGKRAAFLREACGADETLRREVESLLTYASPAQAFLTTPAIDTIVPAAAQRDRGPWVGRRFGSYDIAALLGAGGMGEVYRARDTKLGRTVAIKFLPHAFTADAERRSRFEREARLLASLNHPHIGSIYGLEHYGGINALVLEFVDGQTLADVLKSGRVVVPRALAIAGQIAEALEAAHDKGIVHRDLKPANIAITREGMVKVLDFGIAKAPVEAPSSGVTGSPTVSAGATHEGVILGTAAYMSPEQARGQAVDKRTDIWAFGCVLYEMVTGCQVFAADTVSDTIVRILDREPDWASLPEVTPPAIRRVLRRCLEKDLKRRLHDVADARIEIDESAREPAPSAREPETAGVGRLTPISWWVAAAAVFALLCVAALAIWPSRPVTPPEAARVTIAMPATHALEKSRFSPIAMSPDGRLLVYTAAAGGGRPHLFLRPLGDLTARVMPGTEGASAPFLSPDGRWLGFYADGALKKVSVAGGVPLTICDAPPVWSATWGASDRIVFATTLASSGLWLVAANGGEPEQITTPKPDEEQHGYPQFLPGTTRILFSIRRKSDWHLGLLTLETREWRALGNARVIGEGAQYLRTGHLVYAQSGGLVATPFDPADGTLDQPPVPLVEQVETSRFGGAYFAIAADAGTLVYLPAGLSVGSRTLLRVDRDGRASPLIDAPAAYQSPAFSPDGRQLAVAIDSSSGSDIWIIDLSRATRIRFTAGGTSAFPVWGLDGSRIAFQSTLPGPWNLFWKPHDATAEPEPLIRQAESAAAASWPHPGADLLPGTLPTLSGAGPQFPMSWSPGNTALAFHERKPNGERDIWTVTPGREPTPFLMTRFDERSPRFSPDGGWLAYVSDESGRDEVYVQPFPGPGPKWLISTDGGVDPVWSRHGRELFYRKADDIMAVPVTTSADFSAGRPRRLFGMRFDPGDNGPNYDAAPDGTWFVMPRSDQAPPRDELHLVLNWFGEVLTRTGSGLAREPRVPGVTASSLWRATP
jgi:eukaryotic-like serine/threonine-protein kinase